MTSSPTRRPRSSATGGGEVGFVATSGGFVRAGFDPADRAALIRLGELPRDRGHAQLVDGAWPAGGR